MEIENEINNNFNSQNIKENNDIDYEPLVGKHHTQSFEYAFKEVLPILHQYIRPIEISSPDHYKNVFEKLLISFEGIYIEKPLVETKSETKTILKELLYPHECREREMNYSAPIYAKVKRKFDTTSDESFIVKLGSIPIMVKSSFCNLYGKKEEECIKLKEDINDQGGYFIVNGNEKLLRMISINRRNYPIGFVRPSYTKKTKNCSEYAVQIKCVREDLTSQTITFHYLNDGNCLARLLLKKQEYLIPVGLILKSLLDVNDMFIYSKLLFDSKDARLKESLEVLIAETKKYGMNKKSQYLEYLGIRFRDLLGLSNNSSITNEEVGKLFLKEHIMINLKKDEDKFNSIILCIEKLYCLAFKLIKPDNMDSPLNHEILMSGHLYLMVLKEKLEESLNNVKLKIVKQLQDRKKKSDQILHIAFVKAEFEHVGNISKKMENFLATGNLISKTGLDLMQMGGYSILAEKLNNFRYISHFRSVHRGQFFTEMKTTTPRKLLPDSWGFLCPVHTPDGSPCGLLNHLAMDCNIISHEDMTNESNKKIVEKCISYGMIAISKNTLNCSEKAYIVVLNGCSIGYVMNEVVDLFVRSLRYSKLNNEIQSDTEIGFIPKINHINKKIVSNNNFQFPGIFIFTCIARMTRKIKNLEFNLEEIIGPLEQQYLHIACLPEDIKSNLTTHQELNTYSFLSLVAGNTPFCEYNQSPRNMYQCQMAKQTMGTPYFNYPHRVDNKTYRILFPQIPLVHTANYYKNKFESFPSGTNAIVAVLAYTGYDMEDAMIINKSSFERGFGHGSVYKSSTYTLNENKFSTREVAKFRLMNLRLNELDVNILKNSKIKNLPEYIGNDGLPKIGTQMNTGMIYYCYIDIVKTDLVVIYYKESESCIIDQVRIYNSGLNSNEININFTLRIKRNPTIGDKFSSRHGQKGVLSFLWPHVNMPFTESGITPDIIINPHAFPSRMTVGMLIESNTAKVGSLKGEFSSIKQFDKYENDNVINKVGEDLVKNGFNYDGTEILYSGVSGLQLKADIYIGVVYYQRLRHMVNDKAQARSTGPIDVLTRQPVKGRKNNGGIRFGEMERDGLLAHGVSFCLNDRLFKSSDYSEGYICEKCGGLITTQRSMIKENLLKTSLNSNINLNTDLSTNPKNQFYCRLCNQDGKVKKVALPYVLRYLTNELAAMNIKLSFQLNKHSN